MLPAPATLSPNSSRPGRSGLRWILTSLLFGIALWLYTSATYPNHARQWQIPRPPPLPGVHRAHPPPLGPLAKPSHKPFPALKPLPNNEWGARAEQVREAFRHAYRAYKSKAAPHDEIRPLTGTSVDNFNGWGVTLVDSMDTMWLMDLKDEFADAVRFVAKATFLPLKPDHFAPFFETVIRYLGGLLSAYALSGEPILLTRADDLGRKLLPAFNSTKGFPWFGVNTKTGETVRGWNIGALWSEALSCQMEYKYLAHLTGRKVYYLKVERVMESMYKYADDSTHETSATFPTVWDMESGKPATDHFSIGAFADSAHEYLLKQYLLTGRSEPKPLDLYLKSTEAIISKLLYLSPKRQLLYVTDVRHNLPSGTLEHLSCFLPGLLALGAQTLDLSAKTRERHQWVARGLAETCWITYADMATGLSADEVIFVGNSNGESSKKWIDVLEQWERTRPRGSGSPPGTSEHIPEKDASKREYGLRTNAYLLRPETVESFYLMWRTTGEVKWRERGWRVFEAIEKYAKTEFGYASVDGVDSIPPILRNEMPSYFLAETLKYLYLLFVDEEIIPLDEWVFNTEAHPLPVFEWTEWERGEYGIVDVHR